MKSFLAQMGILIIGLLIGYVISYYIFDYVDEDKYKDYIIEHQDEIVKGDPENGDPLGWYKIPSCEYEYITDITIRKTSDSVYDIVFWGDRDSWKWKYFKDIDFEINIPKDFSTNESIEKDLEIFNILKSK